MRTSTGIPIHSINIREEQGLDGRWVKVKETVLRDGTRLREETPLSSSHPKASLDPLIYEFPNNSNQNHLFDASSQVEQQDDEFDTLLPLRYDGLATNNRRHSRRKTNCFSKSNLILSGSLLVFGAVAFWLAIGQYQKYALDGDENGWSSESLGLEERDWE